MANWNKIQSRGTVQDRRGGTEVLTEKRSAVGQTLPVLGRPVARRRSRAVVQIGGERVGTLGRK